MSESQHLPGAPRPGMTPQGTNQPRMQPAPGVLPKVSAMPMQAKPKDDLSSIAIVEETVLAPAGGSKIRAFGVKDMASDRDYKRHSTMSGAGAVHVKSFHGRLSDEGLQFVDDKINEWLENHPQVEVKFATSTVGLFDGKIKDLALIVNVWY